MVGAVIVKKGKIIGQGYHQRYGESHAEVNAIKNATEDIAGSTFYVTLEPCIMCAAALVHARVKRLVFGARDHRWGGVGSLFDLSHDPRVNHEIEVVSGVMEKEAAELLQRFYQGLRQDS